jgi:hypothetical protein
MVLIAEIWTAADARLANNNSTMFAQRCVRCKIKREDCPGIGRQCDKFHRSDRKTIYWRLLRIVGGFKGVETLEFNYNGTIAGKRKARPGMFGNKDNERGNGIHQPPWNPTAFSLLKWEVRNRHKQLGNQPRKQSRGFAVYM